MKLEARKRQGRTRVELSLQCEPVPQHRQGPGLLFGEKMAPFVEGSRFHCTVLRGANIRSISISGTPATYIPISATTSSIARFLAPFKLVDT